MKSTPTLMAVKAAELIAGGCCINAWNGMNYYPSLEREEAAFIIDREMRTSELLLLLKSVIRRLEHLGSEETGRCEVTEAVRAAIARHEGKV